MHKTACVNKAPVTEQFQFHKQKFMKLEMFLIVAPSFTFVVFYIFSFVFFVKKFVGCVKFL